MTVKRVVFIRPGETEWNKQGIWQGHVMIPLNDHGRAQSERLAQFIRNIGLDALYSSDLRRAMDTAKIIADKAELSVKYDGRLRERSIGDWQGLKQVNIVAWYPDEYDALCADPYNYVVPHGESRQQVYERVRVCFDEIVATGGETVGIVSHTTAIKALLDALVPGSDPFDMNFRNMSVTTIQHVGGDEWQITQLDDVTHLEGMPSSSFPEVERKTLA